VILNVEERRKDYWQMMIHHVITTILVIASYTMDFTRVGCLILVLFDFCDILLPLAKMLKYLELEPLPDVAFVAFLVGWLVTRQWFFSFVVLSVIRDVPRILTLVEDGLPTAVLTRNGWLAYSILLSTLELLMVGWFYMIARIAVNAFRGKPVDDSRSDDESESSERR